MRLGSASPVRRSGRILILEDDFLNAFLIEDSLKLVGHAVVGPAKTVSQALKLLETRAVDAAILDLQIDDEISYEVGGKLEELGIPWAITTAHPPSFVGPQFSHVPVLPKPFAVSALLDLTEKLLDGGAVADPSVPQQPSSVRRLASQDGQVRGEGAKSG